MSFIILVVAVVGIYFAFSFTVKEYINVMVVGPSGSGKSTLINDMLTYYNVDSFDRPEAVSGVFPGTRKTKSYNFRKGANYYTFFDTRGFLEAYATNQEILDEILETINTREITNIFLVINYGRASNSLSSFVQEQLFSMDIDYDNVQLSVIVTHSNSLTDIEKGITMASLKNILLQGNNKIIPNFVFTDKYEENYSKDKTFFQKFTYFINFLFFGDYTINLKEIDEKCINEPLLKRKNNIPLN
eukprot:TRINITY_DN1688_c0_g1_i2.p2 TRINITY_DN1688_c0_g1~~TRINITY_DN1688_c0_g1_i2.p2  ORF type:complete len:244 (+),score=39.50 TRINITY_DN1688_c0_g1_i2:907-1638(+)